VGKKPFRLASRKPFLIRNCSSKRRDDYTFILFPLTQPNREKTGRETQSGSPNGNSVSESAPGNHGRWEVQELLKLLLVRAPESGYCIGNTQTRQQNYSSTGTTSSSPSNHGGVLSDPPLWSVANPTIPSAVVDRRSGVLKRTKSLSRLNRSPQGEHCQFWCPTR
jgi:hypothetical protein